MIVVPLMIVTVTVTPARTLYLINVSVLPINVFSAITLSISSCAEESQSILNTVNQNSAYKIPWTTQIFLWKMRVISRRKLCYMAISTYTNSTCTSKSGFCAVFVSLWRAYFILFISFPYWLYLIKYEPALNPKHAGSYVKGSAGESKRNIKHLSQGGSWILGSYTRGFTV